MKINFFIECGVFSIVLLLMVGCSPSEPSAKDYCDDHYEILSLLEDFSNSINENQPRAYKIIESNGVVDSVMVNPSDLISSIESLENFDIALPNLMGRYRCYEEVDENGQRIEVFEALEDDLSIQRLFVAYGDEPGQIKFVGGHKRVGSVLAAIDEHFKWLIEENALEIHIDYQNLFGRESTYHIFFKWSGN